MKPTPLTDSEILDAVDCPGANSLLTVCRAIEAARDAQWQEMLSKQEPVALDPLNWTPCMKLPVVVHVRQQRQGETHVSTREGITPVKPDDLIMRGVSGEEYPIGREIFEKTYTLNIEAPQPAQQERTFTKYEVDNADDWSEWVDPKQDSYLMACCDCDLVHELQFRVAEFADDTTEYCYVIEDNNLHAQFRAKRRDDVKPAQQEPSTLTYWADKIDPFTRKEAPDHLTLAAVAQYLRGAHPAHQDHIPDAGEMVAQPAQQELTITHSYTVDMDKVRRDEKERGEKFLRDLEGGTTWSKQLRLRTHWKSAKQAFL